MEYLALIAFVLASAGTPGPNNTLLMASGANHGFRRSMPHFMGVEVGFPAMVVAVGLGAASVFTLYPILQVLLKIVGALYLLFLAYKIASSSTGPEESAIAQPLTFIQAALFQWVNPKAWVMAVGAVVTYPVATDPYIPQVLIIALFYVVFGAPCSLAWLGLGTWLKPLLSQPERLRAFNFGMAFLLVLSLIPILIELLAEAG